MRGAFRVPLALAAAMAIGLTASAARADEKTGGSAREAPAARSESPEERAARRERLFEALKTAPSEAEGQALADKVWRFWHEAPTTEAQALLDRAHQLRRWSDLEAAEATLDALVALAPDFPEGWNQRAFVRFLRENYTGSLEDIRKTLALEPKHFGALSGRFRILALQGRITLAQNALTAAVAIHPWIQERRFLARPVEPELPKPPSAVDL